jgi:hypothetical protein
VLNLTAQKFAEARDRDFDPRTCMIRQSDDAVLDTPGFCVSARAPQSANFLESAGFQSLNAADEARVLLIGDIIWKLDLIHL